LGTARSLPRPAFQPWGQIPSAAATAPAEKRCHNALDDAAEVGNPIFVVFAIGN
jgi:hypothetical protein